MPTFRLRRFPALYWLVAVSVAGLTTLTVARLVSETQSRARAWGPAESVAVAARDLPAGTVVGPGDVVRRVLPRAAVPDGDVPDDPEGRATSMPVVAGEVLLEAKLAPWGVKGARALLPRDTRGVAVPAGPGTPPVVVGDRVDVLAAFAPTEAADGQPASDPAFPVARSATVIAVRDDTITVAVRPSEAPRVVFALANGSVTLALTR